VKNALQLSPKGIEEKKKSSPVTIVFDTLEQKNEWLNDLTVLTNSKAAPSNQIRLKSKDSKDMLKIITKG